MMDRLRGKDAGLPLYSPFHTEAEEIDETEEIEETEEIDETKGIEETE